MTRRIGIYPGTFDPVHQGHIAFCVDALKRGEVDEIILLPERSPRYKPDATALSRRIPLLEVAIASFPQIRVMSLRSDTFTTQQTLPELQEYFKDSQLSLLIGSDIVSSLDAWDKLDVLLNGMSLIIGMRDGDAPEVIERLLERIGQTYNMVISYTLIETAHAHVASSHIRSGKMVADFGHLTGEWR